MGEPISDSSNKDIQPKPEIAPRKKVKEVFHFEDDVTSATLTARFLKFEDIKSNHAETFPDAMKALDERKRLVDQGKAEPYPWAILDWDGKGGNGGELAERFHAESPSTVLTIVTGREPDNEALVALRKKGIPFSYLGKGKMSLEDLRPHIQRAERGLNNEPLDEPR